MSENQIDISFILCSRNDNYCGDSVGRLRVTLNYLAELIVENEKVDRAEVIVSDWGSKIPLRDVLELTNASRSIVRFLTIPISITSEIDSPFSEVHALNAAARISKGKQICRIDQDTIVGQKFFDVFYKRKLFDSNSAFWSTRRDMSIEETAECVKNIEKYFEVKNIQTPKFRLYGEGFFSNLEKTPAAVFSRLIGILLIPFRWSEEAVGIFMVPRDVWHNLRGYNEEFILYNHMEVEFAGRIKLGGIKLRNLGPKVSYCFLHQYHPVREIPESINEYPLKGLLGKFFYRPKIIGNDENWGLSSEEHKFQLERSNI